MEQLITWFILINLLASVVLFKMKLKPDGNCYAWVAAVMAAIAIASAIQKGVAAHKQNKLANDINPNDPTYKPSEFAKANLGLAQQLYNGRMAGAADMERNIQTAQSNTIANINRNATNSSQALALAAATQGQTNASLNGLQTSEAQNKYGLAGQLYQANRDMNLEDEKVYNDLLRKNGNDVQAKAALRQSAATNMNGIFSDLASGAFAGASMMGGANGAAGYGGTSLQGANIGGNTGYPGTGINTGPGNFAAPGQLAPLYWNAVTGKWQR